jgi:hypothetical protein
MAWDVVKLMFSLSQKVEILQNQNLKRESLHNPDAENNH